MVDKLAKEQKQPHHKTALLLIDVINDFDFPEFPKIENAALAAAHNIAKLKRHCVQLNIPTIYVNDNFGVWRSDFEQVVRHCTSHESNGAAISRLLEPEESDYFVLKPKHSGFYSTTLDVLLGDLGCRQLILCGFAGNICVLFTANDAYMRDFKLFVPADCVASNTEAENAFALKQMSAILKADIMPSAQMLDSNKLY